MAQITLVIAGAGCGKTTLLTSLMSHATKPVGWITIGEADNDPVEIDGRLTDVARTLGSPETVRTGGLADVPSIIGSIPEPFYLILDDYDRIHDGRVHDLMNQVINAIPPHGVMVFLSRTAPPLRLGRLRAQGKVRELGSRDLRFTLGETYALLCQYLQTPPTDDAVWQLWHATAGWAVGVALAGLAWSQNAIGDQDDPELLWREFVDAFVREEVLDALPEEDRQLALAIPDLPYVTNELLAVVTSTDTIDRDIEAFSRTFPYLEPVQYAEHRFVLQPLIASSLRSVANRELSAEQRQTVQTNAIRYLMDRGDIRAACRLATRAPGVPWQRELVETICWRLADRSDFDGLAEILAEIPDDWRQEDRNIQYWTIISRLGLGITHGIADSLDAIESSWLESGDPRASGRLLLCRGMLAYYEHDREHAEAWLQRAFDVLPTEALTERMYAQTMLGQMDLDDGRDARAAAHLKSAGDLAIMLPTDEQWAWKAIAAERANTYALRGDLYSATTKYKLMIDELPPLLMHLEGWLRCRLVTLWIERDDLEQARIELRRAERLRPEFPGSWHHDLALARARIRIASGDIDGAEQLISMHIKQVRRLPAKNQFVLLLSRIWLRRGELSLVHHWLADMDSDPVTDVHVFGNVSRELIEIEADLAQGEFRKAADSATTLADTARTTLRWSTYIEANMRKAVAMQATGDEDESFAAARAAMEKGIGGGFVRSLLVPGFDTAEMFDQVFREFHDGPSVRQRLRHRKTTSHDGTASMLTPRELEIMTRVAAGESNQEIADSLFISTNTVRNHLVKAFRQLESSSRSEAVFRARELGLLD
ncbi:MAG TPA: LuxR C-terminal-related transcriptional regulator [Thermomicrobiales bacterium]|nr:LuxR C-terminal-related transcriptional regulator [Thermomicrobiales bacterium]